MTDRQRYNLQTAMIWLDVLAYWLALAFLIERATT
jgi:hypothetical protein